MYKLFQGSVIKTAYSSTYLIDDVWSNNCPLKNVVPQRLQMPWCQIDAMHYATIMLILTRVVSYEPPRRVKK